MPCGRKMVSKGWTAAVHVYVTCIFNLNCKHGIYAAKMCITYTFKSLTAEFNIWGQHQFLLKFFPHSANEISSIAWILGFYMKDCRPYIYIYASSNGLWFPEFFFMSLGILMKRYYIKEMVTYRPSIFENIIRFLFHSPAFYWILKYKFPLFSKSVCHTVISR